MLNNLSYGSLLFTVFRELQSDMSEIEAELKSLGIPYVSNRDYLKNMLFTGLTVIPESDDMVSEYFYAFTFLQSSINNSMNN